MKTVDKYRFNEELATIEDGVQTFMAQHTILKRPFTLKIANQSSPDEKKTYNYLIKEAQVLKKLIHPSIYKCHKLLRSKNNFYVIFDSLEGQTLQSLIKSNIHFDHKLLIIKHIIETLIFINSQRIAYLGLCPKNIIVHEDFSFILKNFGYAEEFEAKEDEINLEKFQGTINNYSPPELSKGKIYLNSDFYSLGMLINNLFEKEFEFGPKEKTSKIYKITDPKKGVDMNLDLSLLKELGIKLTKKDVSERTNFYELVTTKSHHNTPEKVHDTSLHEEPRKSYPKIEFTKSVRDLGLGRSPQLLRSRSIKNIEYSDKKEISFNNVQEFALFIIKKRNFCQLLLNLCGFCIRNREVNVSTILTLSFLLMKKVAFSISQLAKLVKQGNNYQLVVNRDIYSYFKKTKAYEQFSSSIDKEMLRAQMSFQELLSKVKNTQEYQKNQELKSQVRQEKINNSFIKRTVLDFILQMQLLPTEEYLREYSGNSLYYLYILSLLSDHETYDDMYQVLFTEGFCPFENEPFIKELSHIDKGVVMELTEYNVNVLFSEQNYRSPLAVQNTKTAK